MRSIHCGVTMVTLLVLLASLVGCSNLFTGPPLRGSANTRAPFAAVAATTTTTGSVTVAQEAELVPNDSTNQDDFGAPVSVSGDTAVFGAGRAEAAYVFVRSGSTWSQQAKLVSPVAGYRFFGSSVAISGDTILVGAPYTTAPYGEGAAFVFVRSGSTWALQTTLNAPQAQSKGDNFGTDVALDGDTALIGDPLYIGNGNATVAEGAAFVFVRSGTTWTLKADLEPSNFMPSTNSADGADFGQSVALSGDTVLVGSPLDSSVGSNFGSVHVFAYDGSTWSEQAKLTANDAAAYDHFGVHLALSGKTAAVSLPFRAGPSPGSVYVFSRSGTAWSQEEKLTASDAQTLDGFGSSIAINGNLMAVGAEASNERITNPGAGRAYLFFKNGSTWSQQAEFTGSDTVAGDNFGRAVAMTSDRVLVGAFGIGRYVDQYGNVLVQGTPGKAYVFAITLPSPPAGAVFTDTFNRLDSPDIGNGWIEKNPSAFSIQNDRVVKASSWGYRDIIVHRPANESLLNVQAQTEFTDTSSDQWAPGRPQIWVRVNNDTVASGGSLDGYVLFIADNPNLAAVALENGGQLLNWAEGIPLSSPIVPGGTYRLRLSATGTSPVSLTADVEALVGSSWQSIGHLVVSDTSASRISTAGTVGFSGGTEGGRYTFDSFAYEGLSQ